MKKFYLKQKVFALRDRYKVYNEEQKIVFHCEGKMFSLSRRMNLFETDTNKFLYQIRRKVFTFLPKYFLTNNEGKQVAFIRKRFTMLKHRLDITSDFGEFRIEGDMFAHNFSIFNQNEEVVTFRKKWISWGDSYEITILNDENYQFYLALVLMIDACLHDNQGQGGVVQLGR